MKKFTILTVVFFLISLAVSNPVQSRNKKLEERVDSRLKYFEGKLRNVIDKLNHVIRIVNKISIKFYEMEQAGLMDSTTLAGHKKTLEGIKKDIDSLAINWKELEKRLETMEKQITRIDSLNYKILQRMAIFESKLNARISDEALPAPVRASSTRGKTLRESDYVSKYNHALNTFNEGKYHDAIKLFRELVNINPDHELADNAQYWLGECYYALGDYRVAIGEFEKVFSFSDENKYDDAQYKLGICYLMLGDKRKAKEAFNILITKYPDSEYVERAKKYIE